MPTSSENSIRLLCSHLEKFDDLKEWDGFIAKHPLGTPNHCTPWLKTISDTYRFRDFLFMQRDRTGTIHSILPLFKVPKLLGASRYISLPFSDYGGPLCLMESKQGIIVQKIIDDHLEKQRVVEIRGALADCASFKPYFHYKRHTLNLERNLDEIKAGINKSTILKSIKKAEKSGVTTSVTNEYGALCEFFKLNNLTRKKHGVPGQPFKFFRNLYKNVIKPGHGFISIARHKEVPVCASIYLTLNDKMYYKYNASDPRVLKTLRPNHLLFWNTIKVAKERGFRLLDLGRTSPDNEGLMRYKNMWGTECTDIPYFFYPRIEGISSIRENGVLFSLFSFIWSKLPDMVIEVISPLIYRYLA